MSGKSRAALELFHSRPDSLLIVPTATMAEHLRHNFARAGLAFRPRSVQTVSEFLAHHSPLGSPSEPLLHFLIETTLERLRPAQFRDVAEFPGFVRALADLFDEAPESGLGTDLDAIFSAVRRELRERGKAHRAERLRSASPPSAAHIVLDGFFRFSTDEVRWITALSCDVTVTLPDWPGSESARAALLSSGFQERCFAGLPRAVKQSRFTAATAEAEAEQIAKQILDRVSEGRLFREIAIVLRTRDPYAQLMETTLARFGIPARFYFSDPLSSHPAIAFLATLVQAFTSGWDYATLARALRMPVSGLGGTLAGDELDFQLRAKMPAAGLPVPGLGWEGFRFPAQALPAQEWASQVKRLRTLVPVPNVQDAATPDQVHVWRATAAALAALEDLLDDVAGTLQHPCRFEVFWRQVETALSLEPLRLQDSRRNVVHVMDAYEARQWQLPIVFVCGLVERHFPQHHREGPILGDAARRRLGMRTSTDRQIEERFLFDFATSRATEETVLSYPRFNQQGEPSLPSLLGGTGFQTVAEFQLGSPAKPAIPAIPIQPPSPPVSLSASAIETFLQCPFQFFGRYTLKLRRRPAAPRDRLDVLLQGRILHRALAEWAAAPLLGSAILHQVFEQECADNGVPAGYRTEAVRLELLRHFSAFIEDRQFQFPGWRARIEESFDFPLNPALRLRGRIDRIEISPEGRATVIDYKYSAGSKIRDRVEESASGNLVQAGIYLLAAERALGLKPGGMLFCGLKKGVTWDGWNGDSPQEIRDLMSAAEQRVLAVHETISSGSVAPRPTDPDKCLWCDYRDICRIESTAAISEASA